MGKLQKLLKISKILQNCKIAHTFQLSQYDVVFFFAERGYNYVGLRYKNDMIQMVWAWRMCVKWGETGDRNPQVAPS